MNFGNVLKNFATGVGQILTGNFGGAWNTASKNAWSGNPTSGVGTGVKFDPNWFNNNGGGATKTPSSSNDDWARESAALNAQLRALQAQIAAQPKLPSFDILANYNNARAQATQYVTPLYQQKLANALEKLNIQRDTGRKNYDLTRENNEIAMNQGLEDNQTQRVRTGQDLASALAQISQNRDDFLVDDARQFDQARRALMEETAAGGATDTGLGQQAIQEQQDVRNEQAGRQTREFKQMEDTKKMLASRTFDDLTTGDARTRQKRTQDDKSAQISFDDLMSSIANEEKSTRLQNELDMALEIVNQTQSYASQGVNNFLAGLASQGWRPQDIALATQVYRG